MKLLFIKNINVLCSVLRKEKLKKNKKINLFNMKQKVVNFFESILMIWFYVFINYI